MVTFTGKHTKLKLTVIVRKMSVEKEFEVYEWGIGASVLRKLDRSVTS